MASITLERLEKRFGETPVLRGIDLQIADGSYTCVLGPSGCGKTTLLRLLAGFEQPTAGEIRFDGEPASHLPPEERAVGVVFQSYALWPHMTVWENVAFPLQVRRAGAAEQRRRVSEMLEAVGLSEYGNRRPAELSGGQRQRVALARALVARPTVLLLDEPLSALDQHLREQMQVELKALHRQTGTTILHVTHDQEEALSLADQIIVMREGIVDQTGAPHQVWEEPATPFVAAFVGRPSLLPVTVAAPGQVTLPGGQRIAVRGTGTPGAAGTLVLRPEGLVPSSGPAHLEGEVTETLYRGGMVEAVLDVAGLPVRVMLPRATRGDRLGLTVTDAWLLPAHGARGSGNE